MVSKFRGLNENDIMMNNIRGTAFQRPRVVVEIGATQTSITVSKPAPSASAVVQNIKLDVW